MFIAQLGRELRALWRENQSFLYSLAFAVIFAFAKRAVVCCGDETERGACCASDSSFFQCFALAFIPILTGLAPVWGRARRVALGRFFAEALFLYALAGFAWATVHGAATLTEGAPSASYCAFALEASAVWFCLGAVFMFTLRVYVRTNPFRTGRSF